MHSDLTIRLPSDLDFLNLNSVSFKGSTAVQQQVSIHSNQEFSFYHAA